MSWEIIETRKFDNVRMKEMAFRHGWTAFVDGDTQTVSFARWTE